MSVEKHTEISVTYKIPASEALIRLGIPQPPDDALISAHMGFGGNLEIVVTEVAFDDTQGTDDQG